MSRPPIASLHPSIRLRFLALHLTDLQSLRWLGLQSALILTPLLSRLSERQAQGASAILAAFAVCWFVLFRRWVRRRFGRTSLSAGERMRQRYPSRWIALVAAGFLVGQLIWRFHFHSSASDWYISMVIVLWLLSRILDRTNLLKRRMAYASALAGVLLLYPLLLKTSALPDGNWLQYLPISIFGIILLALSLFDLYLLQSTSARSPSNSVLPSLVRNPGHP